MTIGIADISQRSAAKIAGFGLLFMFISGIFASSPDSATVLEKALASRATLRMNIIGDIMMLVFDVVAALGLYVLLKPVNKSISTLAAWFRLLHVAIYGAGIIFLVIVLNLLSGAGIGTDQLHTQIKLLLSGHEYGFLIGLVFFGFHFLLLGYLILKSIYVPKILGIMLIIVSLGYLINSMLAFLMPSYEVHKVIIQWCVFIPAMIAELSLCLWLVFKGHNVPEITKGI